MPTTMKMSLYKLSSHIHALHLTPQASTKSTHGPTTLKHPLETHPQRLPYKTLDKPSRQHMAQPHLSQSLSTQSASTQQQSPPPSFPKPPKDLELANELPIMHGKSTGATDPESHEGEAELAV